MVCPLAKGFIVVWEGDISLHHKQNNIIGFWAGPKNSVRLQRVSASKRCPLVEIRLQLCCCGKSKRLRTLSRACRSRVV